MKLWNFLSFGNKKPMSSAELESPEARAAAAWLETVNPLKNMTASRMQNLFDASRDGDTVHLQWLYNEIEKIDPTLLICQQRRRGALASLDWNIATRNPRRTRGFDKTLAQEQAATLELAFGEADGANFTEAVDHLAGAFFRGFAHVLPKWSEDGLSLKGFDTLDQWNFVRDISTGVWYWNPEADAYTDRSGCRPIPEGTLLSFVCPFHIDYPAMQIYLREAVGEKGWAKFVERFGIPPVILTMPNDIPADQVDRWRVAAEKVAEGGSGAVPGGTGVNFCDGARGINPFKDFTQHQREQIVLMSTGGLLTSLAEAGSGTLAGGAHSETWSEIRRIDSAKLASVINRDIAGRILDRAFPGRPHLAYFAFDAEVVPSPSEVFEDAVKARNAGYLIDKADLEERTGYKLIRAEENPPTPGNFPPRPTLNKEEPAKKPEKERGVLEAFTDDCSPVADAIKELLKDPSKEAADQLMKRLPELLPEDPAMAAIIAEAMAKEFGETIVKNKDGECRAHDPAHCHTHGTPRSREPETRPQHDRYGSTDEKTLVAEPQKNFKRGASSLEAMERMQGGYVDKAMFREETGWIRFDWGDPGDPSKDYKHGHGISHILAKHGKDAKKLPEVIANGSVVKNPSEPDKTYIVTDSAYAVVIPLNQSQRRMLTMFEPKPNSKKLEEIKKYPPAPKRQGR